MPKKYHINTTPVPPRRPRVGKYGMVDWREDCSRCHNCVKKKCIYDRHRDEVKYIRNLEKVDALFFDCMGCFSCVQNCTKRLLALSVNPAFEKLGNKYWTPEIIQTTWMQSETAKIPVSGAGYRGPFSGHGFDSMWIDMSEIVRPTRDGIHGREYISTSVDIGRKPGHLSFDSDGQVCPTPELVELPAPIIFDMIPGEYRIPQIDSFIVEAAVQTEIIAIIDVKKADKIEGDPDRYLPHVAFYLGSGADIPDAGVLSKTRLVEIANGADVTERIQKIKSVCPSIVISVRVPLDSNGVNRAIELSENDAIEVIHVVADNNGDEIGAENPRFMKDMLREIHCKLIANGKRDEITLIAGGGVALAEHIAKALLCGADVISANLPFLVALECQLCKVCEKGMWCPAELEDVDSAYATGRIVNLVGAWHNQLVELMGAMGMREARRLRGDVGRAMFFEELEEESFGKLFGTRRYAQRAVTCEHS